MKLFSLLAFILFSSHSFARQYFQCSLPSPEYSDVMVVNLPSTQNGTLFISSGMENPESQRTLVSIELHKIENGHHFYQVINEQQTGYVIVPSSSIGNNIDSVDLKLSFNGYDFVFSCFSRIYNE